MPRDPIGGVVRNLFDLQRLENDVAFEANSLLVDLFDDIAAEIARRGPIDVDDPTVRQQRLRGLVDEIGRLTGRTYDEVHRLIRDRATDIGVQQGEWAEGQLERTLGAGLSAVSVDIRRGAVTPGLIRTIVETDPFRGAILRDWASRQEEHVVFRVRRQVQLGMAQGETLDDIVRRVRGRSVGLIRRDPRTGRFVTSGGTVVGHRFSGGVLQTSTRETEALVRTAINHVSNRAHHRVYEANPDITQEYEYTATLDSRTSDICMGLDGQRFRYDDPSAPRPPQHHNCRSVTTPVVRWSDLGIEPPDEGTRASAQGQVPASTTYEDWLRDQPKETQVEILGKGRANLFRANRISLRDLIRTDGQRRTLDQLKAMSG